LLFCAAMVAVVLFLTPRTGAAYAMEGAVPTVASADVEHAIPMAATVLYPNESVAVTVKH
jgi:hypothetical protein